ncbi:hypothetical protein PV416_18975 [Streptomyces ipomoeae]|uniref:MAB_1171c family putative transporter n=1 Tax=Streptomyces ipomoeae TaxID=103232 RepID=UPI00114688F9|nr:MAB_1171c family putative transporter [Streptomyces ipomoeae]MDX2823126.1 hypothetical protein [Streptomyces ipomoeae]MDX2823139.1 hypothetical protein [Streptomyces ipomoeae]MDX2878669.1 hypothetical protein [Streptomyces ipomoeae]TQE19729.1 hypothetical protein Sipo7851_43420 [Streptomyces ipomoeae]
MIGFIFGGLPVILAAASLYWARRRSGPRPTGAMSMSALLACFAIAFSAYHPAVSALADSLTPELSRLVSNTFTLCAAASMASVLLHLNHDAPEARRRLRLRLALLALTLAIMAVTFTVTPEHLRWTLQRSQAAEEPVVLDLYSAAYTLYLGYAVADCLTQTWTRARTARRTAQRAGLRTAAAGCVLALIYTVYKMFAAVSRLAGWDALSHQDRCTNALIPLSCAFVVTVPALAVLLISTGLTLPALLGPLAQRRRRSWEQHSLALLDPLWQDITAVLPHIVLAPGEADDEPDFLLHRKVIEINDGILALRPHRSRSVKQAAADAVAARHLAGTAEGDAIIEATLLAAALHAACSGSEPDLDPAPPTPGTRERAGDLRAETTWLRQVSHAYTTDPIVHSVRVMAASPATARR